MAVKAPAKDTSAKGKKSGSKDFDDTNRGVLFQNDKDGNENRPDMTGNIKVKVADFEEDANGLITIRLAAWQKSSDKVGDYLSLSASAPQQQ